MSRSSDFAAALREAVPPAEPPEALTTAEERTWYRGWRHAVSQMSADVEEAVGRYERWTRIYRAMALCWIVLILFQLLRDLGVW